MLDSIEISPIIIILFIAVIFFLIVGLTLVLLKFLSYKRDIDEYAPEAEIFMEGRKNRLPVGCFHNPGDGYTRFVVLKKDSKSSWKFDVDEHDFGLKITPEYSKHCRPDLSYGDLPIYHYSIIHGQSMGAVSAQALTNLENLRGYKDFEEIRFLAADDLYTLMNSAGTTLKYNCGIFLKEYRAKDIGQPMPENVDEFVKLIQHAKEVFEAMSLDGEIDPELLEIDDESDIQPTGQFLTTYEPVKEITPITTKVKRWIFDIRGKDVTENKEVEETTEDKHLYKVCKRTDVKIVGMSFEYAFNTIGYATQSQDIRNIEDLARQQGRDERNKEEDKIWKYVIPALAIIGIVILGAVIIVKAMG